MSRDEHTTYLDKANIKMTWKTAWAVMCAIALGVAYGTYWGVSIKADLKEIRREQFPRAEMLEFSRDLEDSNPGLVVPRVSIRAGTVEENSVDERLTQVP